MTKKKRGRGPVKRGFDVYTGCGRQVRYRDGKRIPCECQSCKEQR